MKFTQNQRAVIMNGALWASFWGFCGYFLTAYAVALNATNIMIGLLGAIPFIAQLFVEAPGAKLTEYVSRLKLTMIVAMLSRLSWILIIVSPYVFEEPILGVAVGYFFARMFSLSADPAWTSLLADIVPARIRGHFFGTRQRIISLVALIFSIVGGQYLGLFPKDSPLGFGTMFVIGIVFGIASILVLGRIKEPKNRDHSHHSFKEFFKVDGTFRVFCITSALFSFAHMFAAPFFAVYMLRNLDMSYSLFALAGGLATIVKILSFKYIGKLADRAGDKPLILISLVGTALVPLFFIFITPSTLWLIIPAQIISGLAWAGTELSMINLLFAYTVASKRPMMVAEYRIINAVPQIIAPLIGGLVADKGLLILTGIPLVFAISGVMRFMVVGLFAQLPDRRVKKSVSVKDFIHSAFDITEHRGEQHRVHAVKKL